MNLLNIKKELQNLNILVNSLKNENNELKHQITEINDDMVEFKINNPSVIEITNFVDEVKEEMTFLTNKLDEINKKRFFKEITTFENENNSESYYFLKSINIEEKIINIILFLNYNTVEDLCLLNIEDLIYYNINKKTLEFIIKKSCEKISDLL